MGKRAVVFVNILKNEALAAADDICKELEKRGIETVFFSFEGKSAIQPAGKWDIAFSLGGDGTVLYTARCLAPLGVPILPINLGTLGFIAGVDREHWLSVFEQWESGEIEVSRRCMLEVAVERDSQTIMENICLNDIVITSEGIARLINLDVHIEKDGEDIPLGAYRSDGLIISTPTGSTAYSMAAGGPILDPEMEAVILNPICPFTLSNRPFVLPSSRKLTVTVPRIQRAAVLLTVDGQDTFDLYRGDKIFIRQSPHRAKIIFSDKNAYYSALRTKLFWSGGNFGGVNA